MGRSCKKCGSGAVVKNGRTGTGRQKYHCKGCGIYTTTEAAAQERVVREELVEKLQVERLSQRAIARISGMSRTTIAKRLKKSS
jgi:transposase-like protein